MGVTAVIDDERAYWVVLSMATGIGPVRFSRLLEICGGARQAWQATDLELAAAGLERRTADSLRKLRAQEFHGGAGMTTMRHLPSVWGSPVWKSWQLNAASPTPPRQI